MSGEDEGSRQPNPVDTLEHRVASLDQRLESAPSANLESEQQQAREKMGALMDKLGASVNEKGVVATILGDKDETGDHRAAILMEPVVANDPRRGSDAVVGYVALTPDGPMAITTNDAYSNGRAVYDLVGHNRTPEDYARTEEFRKGFKYIAEPLRGTSPIRMSYRLEDPGRTTIHMAPLDRSTMRDVNVEEIFDKSVEKAAKPLEGSKSQAANASKLADSLSSKF